MSVAFALLVAVMIDPPLSLADMAVTHRPPPEWLETALARTEVPAQAKVTVTCQVQENGWLDDCSATSDPGHPIWAEIAVGFCEQLRVGPRTVAGGSTIGRWVEIPMELR